MSLKNVNKLKPCEFEWKINEKFPHKPNNKKNFGFIAQELQEIFPSDKYSIVQEDESGFLKVDYYQVIPLLVKAVQELSAKVEELENSKCNFEKWKEVKLSQGSYSDKKLKKNIKCL